MNLSKITTPSRIRAIIQTVFAAYCVYIGWAFYRFVTSGLSSTGGAATRPSSVEAFLPISAFLAFKRYLATGQWDSIHPAGLTIFIAAIAIAFFARKGFCGYICPVGLIERTLAAVGKKLGLRREPPRWTHRGLSVFKYALLAFFGFTVLRMNVVSITAFLRSEYNLVADAKMMAFFLNPSGTALVVFGTLGALSIIVPYFWCRYLCPYGALLSIFSFWSPIAVTRDEKACINCGKCARVCPGHIEVDKKLRVNSPECIGCMQCVENCPAPNCLTTKVGKKWKTSPLVPGILSVAILLGFYLWASNTGHWDSQIPGEMLKRYYMRVLGGM